ncbi:MAG: hypothetical protein Q7T11_02715, partial [Deltaproteobacteria bacterium]|nr:hypothetical protein [Deltaproteobacteria bacterium]
MRHETHYNSDGFRMLKDLLGRISGCVGSSRSMILARHFLSTKRPVVVITPDLKSALRFKEDLRFFIPPQFPVDLFPPIDVWPYHPLSPNPDVIMERLGLLWKFSHADAPFAAVIPLSAFLRRVIPRKFFSDSCITLLKGDSADLGKLAAKLSALGYQKVPLVEDGGTFAVRGGILDLFSTAHQHPCRIEFFGDLMESIRFIDPATQIS